MAGHQDKHQIMESTAIRNRCRRIRNNRKGCSIGHVTCRAPNVRWRRPGFAPVRQRNAGVRLSWLIDVGMAMGGGGLPCDRMMMVMGRMAGVGGIALAVLEGG
jgi:hypothetical protein